MKADNPAKHFLLAFLLALVVYAVSYCFIEYRRNFKGPWQIAFTNSTDGRPVILVDQPSLAIMNVRLRFASTNDSSSQAIINARLAATNHPVPFDFSRPKPVPYPVPFGRCIFMDTTFLPGTLTFDLFGHEIELLPRVLIIDHEEHLWHSGEVITLPPNKAGFNP